MIRPADTVDGVPAIAVEPIAVSRIVAGDLLGISERTIDGLIASGDLPVLRLGRAVRIRVEDIRDFARRAARDAPENAPSKSHNSDNAAETRKDISGSGPVKTNGGE